MKLNILRLILLSTLLVFGLLIMGCKELPEGLKSVTAAEFADLVAEAKTNDDYVILDVRTQAEYNAGHIEGAVVLDFYQPTFKANLEKLDKDKVYLLYCRSGNRSGQTLNIMSGLEFKRAFNMLGGMNRWVAERHPVVK